MKKAAQDELDYSGQSFPDNKKIVVFPGLELTLTAPNCQATLILDAGYSQKQLSSIGVRIEELKRFVELPIKQTFSKNPGDIKDILPKHARESCGHAVA